MARPGAGAAVPVIGSDRLMSLDYTRGIAVMGILFANIIGMGQPYSAYAWPGGFLSPHDGLADGLWVAQFVLIDGKMRGLFTLLFGAGLVLFTDRARAKGGWVALALLRLFWLLVFGLLHYYLLWRGDILTLYALCGAIALVAVNWSWPQQLAAGLVAYLAGVVWNTVQIAPLWAANETVRGQLPEYAGVAEATEALIASDRADALREAAIAKNGTWLDHVVHVATVHRWEWVDQFVYYASEALPLMLIGMALYRMGLFDGRLDRRTQALWGWAGVFVGILLTLPLGLWVYFGGFTYTGTLLAQLGPMGLTRLPMILGLAALLGLSGSNPAGWFSSRVIAAGRAAFTNYVGTSLVMLLVFQGWALGLFGVLSREQLYLIAIAGCILMLLWSKPWLRRYRFGPLEWLWRCLTYRRLFALRR
ncbi:DUF418 domain-containing protein [Tsuneonella sp. YG55]|uniref:DUF418 domain-containing protein n=1 Tax=Tsuneonella litorea TaxID=2976475 RepID=A0A9X3A7Y0_9SPHN|nr:DUF418 domain-containing protein [Tsuneonella litorea]MCT2558901.1 DUF418 domain-containing protein [Tsuneonella litorea]